MESGSKYLGGWRHLLTACAVWSAATVVLASDVQDILVLHSYHVGLSWTNAVDEGIRAELSDCDDVELHSHFLDTKRYGAPEIEAANVALLRAQYAGHPPALVIVSDNNALKFMHAYGDALFPQTPVVFCGINHYTPAMLGDSGLITGVAERTDPAGTFALIKRMQPALRRCVVIADATTTGDAELATARAALGDAQGDVGIEYWHGLALAELEARAALLDAHRDAVLLTVHNRDPDGEFYTYETSAGRLTAVSPAPVFGLWDFYLGTGVVGGRVVCGTEQGRVAARLARRILSGVAPREIAVTDQHTRQDVVDVDVADEYGLNLTDLPAATVLVNAPRSLWREHGRLIAVVGTVMALEALVIVALMWVSGVSRRRAARRLRQLQTRFEYVLAATRTELCITDAACRLEYVDPSCRAIHGEPAGCRWHEYFGRRAARCDDCDIATALRTRKKVVSQQRLVHEGGRPVEVHTIPFQEDDGAWHVAEFKLDIAARLEAEDKLREAKQMAEDATRAKSEFLANMSHEIRTPMTAVLGSLDLLDQGCIRYCNFGRDEFKGHVRTMRRNGEHLLQVINDILDISKVEAGRVEVDCVACSSVHLLAELRSLMGARAQGKGLEFIVCSDGRVPKEIQTDPLRLRQILINLVGNAIKFTETGAVAVRTRLTRHGDNRAALEFEVADTGVGMRPEQIDQLLTPFSQADYSSTRRFGGTGLGLTISKRLAAMLGGDIDVKSKPGGGSTFTLRIDPGPLEGVEQLEITHEALLVEADRSSPTDETRHDLRGLRVLLVEDGADNQRLFAAILRKAGATVELASDGEMGQAAALAADRADTPFDVILMDMQMPVCDGYAATANLRAAGYAGPIIALTAHALSSDRQRCLDAGCDDHVTKPISRQQLIETVARSARATTTCAIDPGI